MPPSLPLASTSLVLVSFIAGCSAEPKASVTEGPVGRLIAEAASNNRVPRDLMVAIGHIEGGLRLSLVREVHEDDAIPVAGVLELRHGRFNSLGRGAALMGRTEIELANDLALGTEAGARVLDDLARAAGIRREEIASFAPLVEELSGHLSELDRADYRAQVFQLLRFGGTVRARGGEAIEIPPHDEIPIELTFAPPERRILGTPEYAGAIWFETPQAGKWTAGRSGASITMIAIHDTEGGWNASVATLQNDPGKSVHYIVDADGSRVGQFVHEADNAFHVGNSFYNHHMVGIEHIGFAAEDKYQTAMYRRSAELVNDIARRNGLGPNGDGSHLDRSILVGHQEVPDGTVIPADSPPCPDSPGTCTKSPSYGGASNHRDPGVNWEWCQYMEIVGDGATCKCNDAFKLFNCVHDLSEMVRCPSGAVEIVHCDAGCVVNPLGVNDECAPGMSTSGSSSSGAGEGAAATGAGGGGDGAGAGVGGSGGVMGKEGGGGKEVTPVQDAGCAASRARRSSSPLAAGIALLAAAAARGGRSRRRRR